MSLSEEIKRKCQRCPRQPLQGAARRAVDKWDSVRFSSLFLSLSFSDSPAESTPAHLQFTRAVSPPDDLSSNALESDKAQRLDRSGKFGCMLLVVIPLVAIAIFMASLVRNLYPSEGMFLANESDPADVALAFAYSLPLNEMAEMKSYLVQEQWQFVEKWPEIHEPIPKECPYPWDPDFQDTRMIGGDDHGGASSVSLFYNYDCPEYWYGFYVSGLELKLSDGKWQILRWEEICEVRGSGRKCLDSNSFVWRPG